MLLSKFVRITLFLSVLSLFLLHAEASEKANTSRPAHLKVGARMLDPVTSCPGNHICNITTDNIVIGDGEDINGETLSWPEYPSTMSSFSHSGSNDFVMTTDHCSGGSYAEDTYCPWVVHYAPTTVGVSTAHFYITVYVNEPADDGGPFSYTITYNFTGNSLAKPPSCPATTGGSIINGDSRTLGEHIPIVGTGIFLAYSSQFSAQYASPYNTLGVKNQFNPEVWTVSNHHFYDTSSQQLYRGDGSAIGTPYVFDGVSTNYVVSADGDEIYAFDSTSGNHIYTNSGRSGALRYSFAYTSGKLTSFQDSYGNQTSFNRTGGNLTSIVGPYGQTTTISLNSAGQISGVTDPGSHTTTLGYSSGTSLLTSFTKPGGQVSTFSYDTNGYLTQDLGNGGNVSNISQTGNFTNGTITLSTALSRTTIYQTGQSSGNYTRVDSFPDGNQNTHMEYGSGAIVDYDHQRTTNTSVTPEMRFNNLFQRVSNRAITRGSTLSNTAYGETVTYPSGTTSGWFSYTTLVNTSTTSGRVSTSSYNLPTNTMTNTSPSGATSSVQYNSHEQPVSAQIGSDTAWTYTYDSHGRPSGKIQGTYNSETYAYNTAGFLSSITNARSEILSYAYDASGRVTQITLPDSRIIAKTYDANGNLISVTPPSSASHGFTLNAYELLDTYSPPALGTGITKNTTYAYNSDKQLTGVTRPDGQTISYSYDATAGRLNTVTTPVGNYSYTYSSSNQTLSSVTSPDGIQDQFGYVGDLAVSDQKIRTSDSTRIGDVYNSVDTDFRVTSSVIDAGITGLSKTINTTYNSDSVPTQVGDLALTYSYPSARLATTTLNNIADSYTYDSLGNIQTYSATYTPSSTILYTYTLTRDVASRIVGKSETVSGVTTAWVYGYDTAGRLTSVTKNGVADSSFSYDSNSNRTGGLSEGTSISATYGAQDQLLTYGTKSYAFNNNGDLTGYTGTGGGPSSFTYDVFGNLRSATNSSGKSLSYVHDGKNRRVEKFINGTANWYAVYDGSRMATLMQASSSGMTSKFFVYGSGRNPPDYMISGSTDYKIITDHLGTPILVVDSSAGTVIEKLEYNVFGKLLRDSNSCFTPFGFAGGIYDPDTGFVRFGARDYDPATGRWTTKDPIRFAGGDTNLYGYVLNDPVNFVDPSGKIPDNIVDLLACFNGADDNLIAADQSAIDNNNQQIANYQKTLNQNSVCQSPDAIQKAQRQINVLTNTSKALQGQINTINSVCRSLQIGHTGWN